MRKGNIILWMILLGMVGVSCSDGDDVAGTPTGNVLTCDFIFSIRQPGTMRMANEVVQTTASEFRGIQDITVIPFKTAGSDVPVAVTDEPLLATTKGTELDRVQNKLYYYINHCEIAEGTNRMLAYGQAAPVAGKESEKENGKLVTTLTANAKPAEITFQLQQILTTNTIQGKAQDLADYLTTIANTDSNTDSWSTTKDETLSQLYKDFIKADPNGTGLLAGSAAYVKEHVKSLKSQLDGRTDKLSEAIKTSIGDIDNVACLQNQYPSSLGLPDGAAALRWTGTGLGNQFSVRTETSTLDNINNVSRFTHPAELWYYVNSAIKTSTSVVGKDRYETKETWEELLNHYTTSNVVDWFTKSVAVKDPLQYGVARLHTVLTAAVTDCPLTGVIVGGQHTVGFDFLPKVPKSDVDARFIYDKVVSGTETNTLVLQSYDGEKVPVVLEFQNNGSAFTGRDGIVYPGTKFYLVAYLDPAGKGTGACAGRVFTQDFTTTANMTVTSMANAYTCIPDLLEPRLEIGVQVVTQWIMSTPTTVKL